MVVATLACLAGLAAVLVVLYREDPAPPRPAAPPWDPLPTPAQVAATVFPLTLRGYDPGAVDAYVQRLGRAYDDLLAVAGPAAVEEARRRAKARTHHREGPDAGGAELKGGDGEAPMLNPRRDEAGTP